MGDQVLANVGAVLRGALRSRDFAGRNGGEEFAVLLPDTEIAAALEIAERIRAAIAEITLPGSDVSVTASIGVAGYPDHASTLDRLERLADAALYVAKRQGRNRVELAELAEVADAVAEQAGPGHRRWHGRHPGRSSRAVGQRFRAGAGAQGRPGVSPATPGSAWPTGRGRSAARAWSAGSRPRPSRPCRAATRWSARPS